MTASLVRAYADIAGEMEAAGYTVSQAEAIRQEVAHYDNLRKEIQIASGDYIDLKAYEPAMRRLLDTYIRASESEQVSSFDDLTLIELIVKEGMAAVDSLPEGIRADKEAVAETIENNVRKVITDELPINPKYYERMSELLDALIQRRRDRAIGYAAYLAQIVELAKAVANPSGAGAYPPAIDNAALRALYDNLSSDADRALAVDAAVRAGWPARQPHQGEDGEDGAERRARCARRRGQDREHPGDRAGPT